MAPGARGGREEQRSGSEEGEEEEEEEGISDLEEGIVVPDINVDTFEELHLEGSLVAEARNAWATFLRGAESREMAGEALFAAVLEAAPSLQSFFKGPRAIIAERFLAGVGNMISYLDDPPALKVYVETLGFHHLHVEVTVPRVAMMRDGILEFLALEAGDAGLSTLARAGVAVLLNYAGGAFIFIRAMYAPRVAVLCKSWAAVSSGRAEAGEEEDRGQGVRLAGAGEEAAKAAHKRGAFPRVKLWSHRAAGAAAGSADKTREEDRAFGSGLVPTTFPEMFCFNAAVMGFGVHPWMEELLASFDKLVASASSANRLQEECDVLSLKLGRLKGNIDVSCFKAIMLASLRSLLPKDWNSAHEAAWSWLWDSAECRLKASIGQPARRRKAVVNLFGKLAPEQLSALRSEMYAQFFAISPAGQEFFKQSNTRLHFIAGKILSVVQEIFDDPHQVVEDISALGLRHVGYGAPAELFAVFVAACSKAVRGVAQDEASQEAFTWALSLVARILGRAVDEGSTAVMKAINANSAKLLRRALYCAPRCERSTWVLNVQVGTQSISPLSWALQSGRLDAAEAILSDLLTIRADRERYYYGVDELFQRHPDIVQRLLTDAPRLLHTLLDKLIWRSRLKRNGKRRANFYVKHLLVDADGKFAPALQWLAEARDAKAAVHPVVALVTDTVWGKLAFQTFVYGNLWLMATLAVFVLSQAVLCRRNYSTASREERIAVMACRSFIYTSSLGRLIFSHVRCTCLDLRRRSYAYVGRLCVPRYLTNWQDGCSLVLTVVLMFMLATEPMLFCLQHYEGPFPGAGLFTDRCPEADGVRFFYSVLSMLGILLYSFQLLDLAVCSTRFSAFVLICGRLLPELFLCLFMLSFVVLAFASCIAALDHHVEDFAGIERAAFALAKMSLGLATDSDYESLKEDWVVHLEVFCFLAVGVLLLLNVLVCQLIGAYNLAHEDMVGIARLNRAKVVVETMPSVAQGRWERFVASLGLQEPREFNEGDLGLPGCLVLQEPADGAEEVEESIRRYGGSREMPWPKEDLLRDEPDDKVGKVEKLMHKAMKRATQKHSKGHKSWQSGSANSNSLGSSGAGSSWTKSSHTESSYGSERGDQ